MTEESIKKEILQQFRQKKNREQQEAFVLEIAKNMEQNIIETKQDYFMYSMAAGTALMKAGIIEEDQAVAFIRCFTYLQQGMTIEEVQQRLEEEEEWAINVDFNEEGVNYEIYQKEMESREQLEAFLLEIVKSMEQSITEATQDYLMYSIAAGTALMNAGIIEEEQAVAYSRCFRYLQQGLTTEEAQQRIEAEA